MIKYLNGKEIHLEILNCIFSSLEVDPRIFDCFVELDLLTIACIISSIFIF